MAERPRPIIRGGKAGFRREGTLRQAHFSRGRHHDVHVMSVLRDEWEALPRPKAWDLP